MNRCDHVLLRPYAHVPIECRSFQFWLFTIMLKLRDHAGKLQCRSACTTSQVPHEHMTA